MGGFHIVENVQIVNVLLISCILNFIMIMYTS